MDKRPSPFLYRIFPSSISAEISEGWIYSPEEAEVYGGYTDHQGVDFATPISTPVLAAADGIALASFEEVPIRYPGPAMRIWHGEPVYWGHGLHIMILHPNNLVTIYAHLHKVMPEIEVAYLTPYIIPYSSVIPQLLAISGRKAFQKLGAVRIRAGQQIGFSGVTGMGMGEPTYERWLNKLPYRANDEPHVHFAVSRLPAMSEQTHYIDPFNIRGYAHSYPAYRSNWANLSGSLWLE